MNATQLSALLEQVRSGELGVEQALQRLEVLPYADLGFARVDHHRVLRQGFPEVIFAPGKSAEQIVAVTQELQHCEQTALITRLTPEQAEQLVRVLPNVKYNSVARTATMPAPRAAPVLPGQVVVITAGTSDLPVAEEAIETLLACGVQPKRIIDVGVAGLHRLLSQVNTLREADVLIVVAGMEGALASVVGGLVKAPVIAVPTSIGYGAAFEGVAALLGMLTSCAAGVTCVNIDNGFGAAMAACRMLVTFSK